MPSLVSIYERRLLRYLGSRLMYCTCCQLVLDTPVGQVSKYLVLLHIVLGDVSKTGNFTVPQRLNEACNAMHEGGQQRNNR
jgi:hypothetical protein